MNCVHLLVCAIEAIKYSNIRSNASPVYQLDFFIATHCRMVNMLDCASRRVTLLIRVYPTPPSKESRLRHEITINRCLFPRKFNKNDLYKSSSKHYREPTRLSLWRCARHSKFLRKIISDAPNVSRCLTSWWLVRCERSFYLFSTVRICRTSPCHQPGLHRFHATLIPVHNSSRSAQKK